MRATSGGGRPCTSVLPSPRPARKSAPTTSGIRSRRARATRRGASRAVPRCVSRPRMPAGSMPAMAIGRTGRDRKVAKAHRSWFWTDPVCHGKSITRSRAFAEWAVARPRRRGAGRSQFCHGQFWHAATAASLAVALLDLGFDRGRPRVHSRRCDRRVVRRHHHGRMSSIFAGSRGRRAARDSPGSARAIWPKAVIYGH